MFIKWSNFRDKRKSSHLKWHQTGGIRLSIKRWEIRFFKRRLRVVFNLAHFHQSFLPILWITFETETICLNFKLYHQRNTEFNCCVVHEQAVGARCTIVYIYREWTSSLNMLLLEKKEKCNEKICIVLSIREGFESKSKKMPRMLLIYTTCTFAVVYILWITTITKYILIQLKSICDKTLATKVERRLMVEIKWTIMFANSFIWFCVPSNIPHNIWQEFLNFIGLETILSDSKHHLRVNGFQNF